MLAIGHLIWKIECHLNRSFRRGARETGEFVLRRGSVGANGEAAREPALAAVVTTHRRPGACAKVLEALADSLVQAALSDVFVLVLNDPGDADYALVLDVLERRFPDRFAFFEARSWLGKRGFWRVHQHAFDVVRALAPQRVLFLQDDLAFRADFIREILALWDAITDPNKAVLYLLAMADDEVNGRWIRHSRTSAFDGRVWRTQWFDLQAFLVDRRFFEILKYRVLPVPCARWRDAPERGSGVNEQYTRRLFRRGSVYQVQASAVFHGEEASVMNAGARKQRPLDNAAELRRSRE